MLKIIKTGDLYEGTYKRDDDIVWKTNKPITAEELIRELQNHKANQIDIFDALKKADPKRFSDPSSSEGHR